MSDGYVKSATISDCGTYRYHLAREWSTGKPILFVMLNPSTADAGEDDPTIRKCLGFATRNAAAPSRWSTCLPTAPPTRAT